MLAFCLFGLHGNATSSNQPLFWGTGDGGRGAASLLHTEHTEQHTTHLEVVQRGVMVRRQVHGPRAGVVQVRERDPVLGPDLVTNDDLVDIVELVPVLLVAIHVSEERLELRSTRHRHVESLGREERLLVEQVPVVPVFAPA